MPPKPAPALVRHPTTHGPMATLYWARLHALLKEAAATADASLLPTPAESDAAPDKGPKGRVAVDLQGRLAATAEQLAVQAATRPDPEWLAAWHEGALGSVVEYGVASASAPWAADRLAVHHPAARSIPTDPTSDCSPTATHPDRAVEAVRVRVWESEPACMPLPLAERLVRARRRMRRFKQRIDLCTRILCAVERRGRRLTQAALDKLKLALEKADLQAAQEDAKLRAADAAKQDKAQKAALAASARLERVKEKEQKASAVRQKEKMHIKRKRQTNAQASFMKRFVKQKTNKLKASAVCDVIDLVSSGSGSVGGSDSKDSVQSPFRSQSQPTACVLPVAMDRDVMSVAWWILSEMAAPDLSELDSCFKGTLPALPRAHRETAMREHLAACGRRRQAAESRLIAVLSHFRQQRTIHCEDRTPHFVKRRAQVRGTGRVGPIKLLQFSENHRPAFFGTLSRRPKKTCGRRPFAKDSELDYEYDSADEWEDEEEDAEDLCDVEAEKERANEDAELRILYGSDEEDDDDFLDDGDADDEEDEEDEEEDNEDRIRVDSGVATKDLTTSPASKVVSADASEAGPIVVDLPAAASPFSKKKVRTSKVNRGLKDGKSRKRNRRTSAMKQTVVIHGVSIPKPGEPSELDEYAVSVPEGAPVIVMFNPHAAKSSDFVLDNDRPRASVVRTPRVPLDEAARLDLAVALNGMGTSRDKIVHQFCENRRLRGLVVPPKTEIVRAIGEIATREKRGSDTRAGWYLNDHSLATKLRDMAQVRPKGVSPNVPTVPYTCTPTTAK